MTRAEWRWRCSNFARSETRLVQRMARAAVYPHVKDPGQLWWAWERQVDAPWQRAAAATFQTAREMAADMLAWFRRVGIRG